MELTSVQVSGFLLNLCWIALKIGHIIYVIAVLELCH
jgi:hypothetical protein